MIMYKSYEQPPINRREILRYIGCRRVDAAVEQLMDDCLAEVWGRLQYKVCYRKLPVKVTDDICDFDLFSVQSKDLAKNLQDCRAVVLFAATIGVGIDRLIAKYGHLSPSKALMFQAIGTERVESLCDAFCRDIRQRESVGLRPRFSPGYGDLPLDVQMDVFSVLSCEKHIGLTLNDSLLMSPSKSVTAFVGIGGEENLPTETKCRLCDKEDCAYRGVL